MRVAIVGLMMRHMDAALPPDPSPPGQAGKVQYEYMNFYTGTQSANHPDFIAKMNEQGAQGWYLAAVASGYLFFVREIK